MPEPPYQMAGQSKKMVAEQLLFEQRKIILKWRWKFEDVCNVQRDLQREFATEPPIGLTIARICDIFEANGTVHDMHKQKFCVVFCKNSYWPYVPQHALDINFTCHSSVLQT
jgi:hypothetical protein